MTTHDLLAELDLTIAAAPPEERVCLVVQLAARLATLGAGLVARDGAVGGEADKNLSAEEAARWLGVSKDYLYRSAQKKTGPQAVRIGRRVLFPARDLERWNRQRTGR